MLLGEHAVLHGSRALVCAINRRITVRLYQSSEEELRIISDLGEYQSPLDRLTDDFNFSFVLQAVRQHRERISRGFRLEIESEFPADVGFGSSAAVTVAVHAVLFQWLKKKLQRMELFSQSLETVRTVQGRGSGADVAASVFGGLTFFGGGSEFQTLEKSLPLTAVYCGYKTPTPEVIRHVGKLRVADPEKYDRIFREIDESIDDALAALKANDLVLFGRILDRNQQLMDQMGVNTPELQEIVTELRKSPFINGAKISGSGMGDCAVGIGYVDLPRLGYAVYHLEVSPTGCECHG